MEVLHLNRDSFEKVVNSGKPVLVDFWATWCGPCQKLAPELESLAAAHSDIIVGKINVDDPANVQLAASMGVNSIPALFFYRDGQMVKQLVGYMTREELERKLGI